eukprot:scaffold58530_cov35-Tisochrysis_lutea.AAC.2
MPTTAGSSRGWTPRGLHNIEGKWTLVSLQCPGQQHTRTLTRPTIDEGDQRQPRAGLHTCSLES